MEILQFEITEDHLKLLKRFHVSGGYDGGYSPTIEINNKRPYGNSSWETDIFEILYGIEPEYLTEEQREYATRMHTEMLTVLQICLCTQQFSTGIYSREPYFSLSWKKMEPA